MVSLDKIAWIIRHVLKKLSKDSDVKQRVLYDMINYQRSSLISQLLLRDEPRPEWIQYFKNEKTTPVNAGDPVLYTTGLPSVRFGKITFPQALSAGPMKSGIISLTSTSGFERFYEITVDKLKLKIDLQDNDLNIYKFFIRNGLSCYTFGFTGDVNAELILADPLDGWVIQTEYVNSIYPGDQYYVYSGTITYNGTLYQRGETFTGVEGYETFLGGGKVKYSDLKRKMRPTDPYPMDMGLLKVVILEILTKEFQVFSNQIQDVINDAVDTPEVMRGTPR